MAKILYSVAGEGNGHAVLSKTIIEHLKKKHRVRIYSHGKGYKFLSKFFKPKRILGFHIYYINNAVSSILTGTINTLKLPFMFLFNLKMFFDIITYNPDIIITDFEPFAAYYAKILFKPLISIDNQHIITNTKIKTRGLKSLYHLHSWLVIKTFIPLPDYKFITTFFYPKVKRKNTFLVNTILQNEIFELKPKDKKHILVYQTSTSYKKIFKTLKNINKEFIIYGFDKNKTENNLQFKKFNEKEFFNDLVNCEAVIMNGSFTLMGEAIYLKKPIFSIPINKQFEQMVNSDYLEKIGYGKSVKRINTNNFNKFLKNLKKYKNNLKNVKHDKNKWLFYKLDSIINKVIKWAKEYYY